MLNFDLSQLRPCNKLERALLEPPLKLFASQNPLAMVQDLEYFILQEVYENVELLQVNFINQCYESSE